MTENTAIVAALVGAMVGGAISMLLQVAIFWREKTQKNLETREVFKAKLLNLYLHIGKAKESLERVSESCDKAHELLKSGRVNRLSFGMDSFYPHVGGRQIDPDELYFTVRYTKNIDITSIHRFLDDANTLLNLIEKFVMIKRSC